MQPLHYEPPTQHRQTTSLVVLLTLPIAAFYVGMLVGMFTLAEPFMVLKPIDAAVFFGAPVAIVALGIVWWRWALARRVRRTVIVLGLVWFTLLTAGAVQATLLYLREPWNV